VLVLGVGVKVAVTGAAEKCHVHRQHFNLILVAIKTIMMYELVVYFTRQCY
jgi:hypothetical protein